MIEVIDMESRMDKYYKKEMTFERSKKNEKLYKEISSQISDMDNLPVPDNSNEIDIDGLKKIISSRDEYRRAKEKNVVDKRPLGDGIKKEENKVYDINVLLEEAKRTSFKLNQEAREKRREDVNFLTKLEDANIPSNDDAIEVSFPEVESKKSANTDSLPLDILTDLKGSDNTVVTDPIVKDEITMIKKVRDGETFYSGSFNFTKKDFENDDEIDTSFVEKKNHTGLKAFLLVLLLIILAAAIYFVLTTYVL